MTITANPHLRRRSVLAAPLIAGALALAGCSGTKSASGASGAPGSKALSVWFPGNSQTEIDLVEKTIVPAFEKQTGAKVQVTYIGWGDISTKLNTAFAANSGPDLFGHGPAAAADLVANGRIVPLTQYVDALSDADKKDLASALPGGQVKGIQYLMPLSKQGNLIMYDADAFRQAGLDPDKPPTTWPALLVMARKLTTRDSSGSITRSGLLLPSQDIGREQSFATLLAGDGGSILNAQGTQPAWDSPAGATALNYFLGLYDPKTGVSANLGQDFPGLPPNQQPILLKTAAMEMMSAPGMHQVKSAANGRDLRAMPPLSFPGHAPAAFEGAGPGLMINADSKSQTLAWKFIQYFISAKVSAQYAQGIGAIPLRASAANTSEVQRDPIMKTFLAAAPAGFGSPNVVGWVQVRDVLDKHLEQALHGMASPAVALAQAASAAAPLIKSS